MIAELGCWIVGIVLIVAYFAAIAGLENQREQGLELFDRARSAEQPGQQLDQRITGGNNGTPATHRLPVEETPAQGMPVQEAIADTPASVSPGADHSAALPIAVLRMASIGLEVPVYTDISELNLSRGAGWIEGTAAPNTGGNMAIAAHRDRYFRPLKDIQIGDILELESLAGQGKFRVSRIVIVNPDDVSVLDETLVPTVTLVTCYPFYFFGNAPQRFIVQATAVEPSGKASAADPIPTAKPPGETT